MPAGWHTGSVSRPLRQAAPIIDAACLVAFVVAGRGNHGLDGGTGWFLTVLWPFAVGWFGVALAVGLYRAERHQWWRLVVTWAGGLAVGLFLRAVLTDREALSTFAIVVFAFVGLLTFGWRALAWAIGALGRRGDAAVDGDDRSGEVRAGS